MSSRTHANGDTRPRPSKRKPQQSSMSGGANASSGFSKMHLSALFQRRQGKSDPTQHAQQDVHGDEAGLDGHLPSRSRSSPSLPAPSPHGSVHSRSSPQPRDSPNGTGLRHRSSFSSLPPSSSNVWRRRGSFQSQPSHSRVRRMSSNLASLFSPRVGERDEEPQLDPLITELFENPNDVAAFGEALLDDAGQQEHAVNSSFWPGSGATADGEANDGNEKRDELQPQRLTTKGGPAGSEEDALSKVESSKLPHRSSRTRANNPRKVGRIAAASDFAPIYERTQDKKSKVDTASREGLLYKVVRFPLLTIIWLVIAAEFAAYVLIRQLVNLTEYFVAWRGYKGALRSRLRQAETADEWRDVALELDSYLGYENWKCEDASGMYDWILVKKVLHSLQTMRKNDDAEGLLSVLELCMRNNFAGIENFRLYSETFFGTKYLVENYLSEVEEALAYIAATDKISPQLKRSFYRGAQKNMGRSALCLSGGGAFGYYHIGVVRALLDANLLPTIITGTSAGGLIAALACTRHDDELKRILVPEMADRITACEEPFSVWGPRVWRTGARFDLLKWAEKAQFFTMGSMTFAEAYARTGKVLNISVIPSDRHSPVKLLNHLTAPNCIIWSSLLASAAVPGLLPPVCLMQKTRSGRAVPWNWGHRFKDGSLRVDIPLQDLHSLFNVNYPIVSQVNPHVHLFFFAPKGMPGRPVAHRKGKGWRGGFLLSASEHVLKLNLSMNFKIIRDLDLLPAILGQDWSSVFLQRFSGAVTIWPKTRAWDWVRILSDPDRKELWRLMSVGQSVTFPKLHMIENRVRLEKALDAGRRANRKAMREAQKDGMAGAAATTGHSSAAPSTGGSADGHGGAPPLSTALPHSDTDGTGDDFFSAKDAAPNHTTRSPASRRLHKQLTNGFSRPAASGNGGQAMARRDTADGFTTPDVQTPGELPRHIRVRSMGLDEDDEGSHSYAHQDGGMTEKLLRRHLRLQSAKHGRDHDDVDVSRGNHAGNQHTNAKVEDQTWRQRGSMRNDPMYDEEEQAEQEGGLDGGALPTPHTAILQGRRLNERGHAVNDGDSGSSSSDADETLT